MPTNLPSGFGPRPEYVARGEAEDFRRALIPPLNVYETVSNVPWFITVVGINQSNDFRFFSPTQPSPYRRVVKEARIVCDTANAGASAETMLYTTDAENTRIRMIPGTRAIFDLSTTGIKKVELADPVEIPANALIWLGTVINTNGGTVSVLCVDEDTNWWMEPTGGGGSGGTGRPLPATQDLIPTGPNFIPVVTYLSTDMAKLV